MFNSEELQVRGTEPSSGTYLPGTLIIREHLPLVSPTSPSALCPRQLLIGGSEEGFDLEDMRANTQYAGAVVTCTCVK